MTIEHDVSVVRAVPEDLDALAVLFDAYRVFYRKPSDPELARAFLRERMKRGESVIFLARDAANGDALGFTQLYPSFSSVSARRVWTLNDLYVAADARRRGVARALMERAHLHARQTGALRVVLQTAIDNANAQVLYESLGYVRQSGMFEYALELLS